MVRQPQISALFLMTLWGTLWLTSCQKKCQPPPQERPKSITSNEWRLVYTTSPSAKKNLNQFSFMIQKFGVNFEGEVYKVENNTKFETPLFRFKYNLSTGDAKNGTLRIVYVSVDPNEGQQNQDAPPPAPPETSKPLDYEYQLGKRLYLRELATGYQYEFVPFVGIVDPDSNCTFN